MSNEHPPQQRQSQQPGPSQAEKEKKKQKSREKRKHAEEALAQSQREATQYRHERDEALKEKKVAEVRLRDIESTRDEQDDSDGPPAKKAQAVASDQLKAEESMALHLGKFVAFRHKMWTVDQTLNWLPLRKYGKDDNEGTGDSTEDEESIAEDISEEVKTDAALVVSCAAEDFRPSLRKASVKSQIIAGQRGMRSSAVTNVINAPQDIFGGSSMDYPDFKKPDRANLDKVKALIRDDKFLYDDTASSALDGYMRHPCILKILRSILFGSTAASLGERTARARRPNAKLLGISDVNVPMLAFAATIAYFVLSGQPELTKEGSGNFAFGKFYDEHIRKLTRMEKTSPVSKERLHNLLNYYNRSLFPAEHNVEIRSDRQVREDRFNADLEKEREDYKQRQRDEGRQMLEQQIREADTQRRKDDGNGAGPSLSTTYELSDSDGESPASDSESDGPPSDLEYGDVYSEPHPYSGLPKATQYASDNSEPPQSVLPHSFAGEAPPWHEFGTRHNFEQAELFLRYGCSNPYIDAQLSLNQRASQETTVTMRNAAEFHGILSRVARSENIPQCEKTEITVEYHKEELRTYVVYHKPLRPIIRRVLEDERLQDRIQLYPQRQYVARPGGGAMRIWDEMLSGDDSWNIQNLLGPSAYGVYMQIYVDSTHVTSFGNVRYWSVYLWLANVPKADRNDPGGLGRAQLIGFLPAVDGQNTDSSSALAHHRAGVYQGAFDVILDDVKVTTEFGDYFNLKVMNVEFRAGHTVCIVVSCDYEDMVRAAGILGSNSYHPCPICIVPHDQQWDLSKAWPARSVSGTEELLDKARELTAITGRKEVMRTQSLRFQANTFNDTFGSYIGIYQMFVLDPLHQIEQGEWGRHWWPWIIATLEDEKLDAIDKSYKEAPRHPDVHHFRNGITELKYITGDEQGQVLASIPPRLVGLWDSADHERKILRALRFLAEIHLLVAHFSVHTEVTLEYLDDLVKKYNNAVKVVQDDEDLQSPEFQWPKHHYLSHASDLIRRKGPVDNSETGLGERLHPQVKRDYRRSNKRPETVTNQIMYMAEERDAILHVRANIDRYDAYIESIEEKPEEDDPPPNDDRVWLGAGEQRRVTLEHLLNELADRAKPTTAFRQLPQALKGIIGSSFKVPVKELRTCLVRSYHCLNVHYICMMSYQLRKDVARVHRNWQKQGPRCDNVLIKVGEEEYEFGQVYALFEVTVQTRKLALAYVQRFKTLGRSSVSGYIELQKASVDFVEIDAVERGCELMPPSPHNSRWTVQDLRPDMYLRLKFTIS
ncbi:hypothetical protein GGG16DRAFT_114767 [Schizophyllum commune]